MMTDKPLISVLGIGALGNTLAHSLTDSGFKIKSIYSRSAKESLSPTLRDLHRGSVPINTDELGDILFITTPDDHISTISAKLIDIQGNWTGKGVVHCSGALFSDELNVINKRGALTASFHPLQTFSKKSSANTFQDIHISIEGDDELLVLLENLAHHLGASIIRVTKEQKRALHIAAVFVSNYLVTLMSAGESVLNNAGLDDLKVLEPLIHKTLQNSIRDGASNSLTGPIARGDVQTITSHLHFLEKNNEILSLYKALGLKTLDAVKNNSKAEIDALNRIEQLLK
jgi:predicted short-subunit dehydrogenase-like oxidoreductase (DUF2520 family)